jgi:hypothetical protein
MKPPNLTSQATKTPTLDTIKIRLLSGIREAKLPEDTNTFSESELREVRLWDKYRRPPDMSERSFKLLILLCTQNDELRQDRDAWRGRLEELEDYHSRSRDKLRGEPEA